MSRASANIPGQAESFTPSALVLDMDGLMVDSEPLWFEVESAFAVRRGGAWTHAHADACVGRGLATTLRVMGETFGFPIDAERDTREIIDGFIARVGDLAYKPGCPELLAAAAAVPMAVASSSPLRLIRAVLDRFAIASIFRAIVSGEQVAHPKPAPDIFERAAAELGIAPARCAVLEDSFAGVTAGRAAGMFVIAVPEGSPEGRGFEAVADVVVKDLFEARAVLRLP
jgi:mannitol-1-/sugar-/sorbitol-6-/2-deoxyglucose-6-phosphatase